MINKKEVKHIAELSRIGMNEKDLEKYSKELSGILGWVEKLSEVKTEGVETTDHIAGIKNISKEDRVRVFSEEEKITKLFPEKDNGHNKVKSVL